MPIGNRTIALTGAGLLIVASMVVGAAGADASKPAVSLVSGPIPPGVAPNYRAIVAQNRGSVVGVTTRTDLRLAPADGTGDDAGPDDHAPSRFFHGGPRYGGRRPTHALGSGVVVRSDGLILTNAHVVAGAAEVTVKLADHREFKAKVLGADEASDLAVLKIDAEGLPAVRFADSDALAVGDYVLAIGAPFGLEETATAGIVSAKGRSLPGDGYVPFIQIDAAVNPGNSGGPLFDATGAVVGINSQIYSSTGGYQGVAFAIPSNVVAQVRDQIVKTGRVQHGRLGVEIQTLTQALADSFKLNAAPNGALVAKVVPDSAAARAGLLPGDVILKYNGMLVEDAGQLSSRVNMATPGDAVSLAVWRDGKPMTVAVKIGSLAAETGDPAEPADSHRLGLNLRPLTPDERMEAGVTSGLVVQDAQGPAAEAGIQAGDVVLAVNGIPLQTVAQLREIARKQTNPLALLVQRGDDRLFVSVSQG